MGGLPLVPEGLIGCLKSNIPLATKFSSSNDEGGKKRRE
jgi:hypothetical protein